MNDADIDWSKCTWEGARLDQLRAYRQLSLHAKLRAVEEMCDIIRRLRSARRARLDQRQANPLDVPSGARRNHFNGLK